MSGPLWQVPPQRLVLKRDEVHVWRVSLAGEPGPFEPLLSIEEYARANRFFEPQLRRRFIIAHGVLRTLLGRYLKQPPADVRFRHGVHGKPFLDEDGPDLQFNLSHSADLALLAFSRGRDVGVDVEQVRSIDAWEEIAGRFLGAEDQRRLRALAPAEQRAGFFRLWVAREAVLKAAGVGLAGVEPRDEGEWFLSGLVPAEGFVGAVAASGRHWRLLTWTADCG